MELIYLLHHCETYAKYFASVSGYIFLCAVGNILVSRTLPFQIYLNKEKEQLNDTNCDSWNASNQQS
jgi:hypothetical protein